MSDRPNDRVWLAGQSLAGQNANPNVERTPEDMAVVARSDADALLAELAKPAGHQPNPLADVLRELVDCTDRLVAGAGAMYQQLRRKGIETLAVGEIQPAREALTAARKALETQP